MTAPSLRLVLVLAVLALALGLKVARYGEGHGEARAGGVDRVQAVMAAHGWHPQDRTELDGGVYEQLVFRRDGCPDPIVIALLGGNAEGHEFFRSRHGGDIMLVQGGAIVERPNGLRRQLEAIVARGGAWLGRGGGASLPVLAIAPAADPDVAGCRGPARTAWRATWSASGQPETLR